MKNTNDKLLDKQTGVSMFATERKHVRWLLHTFKLPLKRDKKYGFEKPQAKKHLTV